MLKDIIRELRISNQMTQKELAAFVNKSQQAVAKWEKGVAEPDAESLCIMAHYFNVTTDYLLGYSPVDPIPYSPDDDLPSPLLAKIVNCFNELNEEGQARLYEHADDMVKSGKYKKSASHELGNAANG